jgi:K+-sensing histidine kinase KdpD
VAPGTIVSGVCESLRAVAAQKQIVVSTAVDATLPEVVVDPPKFRQVLYNYLSNALKFTPDGGHVAARVAGDGPDRFRVEVEDDGIGIAAEDIGRLFTPFEQLDASSGKQYGGTGLGLVLTVASSRCTAARSTSARRPATAACSRRRSPARTDRPLPRRPTRASCARPGDRTRSDAA